MERKVFSPRMFEPLGIIKEIKVNLNIYIIAWIETYWRGITDLKIKNNVKLHEENVLENPNELEVGEDPWQKQENTNN